jgi:hypothetical protein
MSICSTASPEGQQHIERLADDLLIGAPAIARELGISTRSVYHLAQTKQLPIGRLGRNLIASRSRLRRAALALAS